MAKSILNCRLWLYICIAQLLCFPIPKKNENSEKKSIHTCAKSTWKDCDCVWLYNINHLRLFAKYKGVKQITTHNNITATASFYYFYVLTSKRFWPRRVRLIVLQFRKQNQIFSSLVMLRTPVVSKINS